MTKQQERPAILEGMTMKIVTGCGNKYVVLNFTETDEPFEVFDIMGKAGGCACSNSEAIARLISWGLRSGADILEAIKHLRGIRCHNEVHEGATSCADAIALALTELLKKKKGESNDSAGLES